MRAPSERTVSLLKEPLLWSGLVAGLILLLGWGTGSHFVFPGRLTPGAAQPPPAAAADAETRTRVTTAFEQLPLLFIENRGQLDPQVAYYVQGRANTLYFTPAGVTFALTDAQARAARAKERREARLAEAAETAAPSRWVVKLDFLDANPQVKPQAEAPRQAIISYFKGKPEDWQTGLKTWGQLRYPNLWPGIDLVYSGTVNRLKYHFEVQPGADPRQIRLAYRGASSVTLTDAGQLEIVTPVGGFQDDRPVVWQEVDGQRVEVVADYALATPGEDSQAYGFRLGSYDPTRPLLLDPAVIVYAGYIGGSSRDEGYGIAVDAAGAAYVTGYTASTQATFPVKGGPDLTYNGDQDAFVAKVAANGMELVYAGYIGGSARDQGNGIAVDGAGAAYVTGGTYSTQATFPDKAGPDLTHNGGYDAFVAKGAAGGAGLVYAGYIGGSGDDWGAGIAVDKDGAAYVTGGTESTQATFPVKIGPDLTYNGGDDYGDAFVAKVAAGGAGLVYAGYIGGSGDDWGSGIAVDRVGAAYVTGGTESTQATFPDKVGPDLTYNGGRDAFVAKISGTATLTVTKAGTGSGTVTSTPAGINCGADCQEPYDIGTKVTLTRKPATGSVFAGWSGDPDCSDGKITMTASKTCTATFNLQKFTLTVTKKGTGSGTVTSSPTGINCGADCQESYNSGTVVTLTPKSAVGSTFAGWSGDVDCGDGKVTMKANKTCTATFKNK